MVTKKREKTGTKNICEPCNYICYCKSDYDRHLLTAKHKMVTNGNKKTGKNGNAFQCECGKIYRHKSGLSRHKRVCKNQEKTDISEKSIVEKPNNDDDYKSMIMLLVNENKELRNTINTMIPKIGDTNINQNLNINVFLNEQCKDALNFTDFIEKIKISTKELENQAELGYVNGVSKILVDNLNSLTMSQRPIHCTDAKRNTLYIKENNEWDKETSHEHIKKGIHEIGRKSHEALSNMKKENSTEYSDIDSAFSNKCVEIQRSIIPESPREVSVNKVVTNISKTTILNKMIE